MCMCRTLEWIDYSADRLENATTMGRRRNRSGREQALTALVGRWGLAAESLCVRE